jgi:hypothetical protein
MTPLLVATTHLPPRREIDSTRPTPGTTSPLETSIIPLGPAKIAMPSRPLPHGLRWAYLRLTSAVGPAPLSILISLIGVTSAAWALTLYQALSMSAPMGTAVRGGMAAEGVGGMAMGGMSAAGWSFAGLAIFVTVWTVMMVARPLCR